MAVKGARETIWDVIDDSSLEAFHDACDAADRLYLIMERTTEKDKAFATAVAWATSIIALARMESSLLSAVLPLYEEELVPLREQMAELNQLKEDVEQGVREMRGPQGAVMPLSMQRDPNRAKQIHDAKMLRASTYEEVRKSSAKISEEREPIQLIIGRIKRTLRALNSFVENRFPIPTRSRNPMAHAVPTGADPIAAWATKYVDNLDQRSKSDAQREALRKARAHPLNKFDRSGQVIVH